MIRFSLLCVAIVALVVLSSSTASARGRRGGMMNCNTAPVTVPAKAENVKAASAVRIYEPAASIAVVEPMLNLNLTSLQALNERPVHRTPASVPAARSLADR